MWVFSWVWLVVMLVVWFAFSFGMFLICGGLIICSVLLWLAFLLFHLGESHKFFVYALC